LHLGVGGIFEIMHRMALYLYGTAASTGIIVTLLDDT
jgi:hypothetical protein